MLFADDERYRNLHAYTLPSDSVHTGIRPIPESFLAIDSLPGIRPSGRTHYNLLSKKIFDEHLLDFRGKDYRITADILLDLHAGYNAAGRARPEAPWDYRTNQRGFVITGDITSQVSFVTAFAETQSIFPLYVDSLVQSRQSVPGSARVKIDEEDRDYGLAFGYVSFAPTRWLHIQAGHDNHAVGHGIRSLLFQQSLFPYPFFRTHLRLFGGKLQYTAMWAGLQRLQRLPQGETPEPVFQRKAFSQFYLSYKPVSWLEAGVYEHTIWPRFSPTKGTLPLPGNYYIPLGGVSTAQNGLDDTLNVLLGAQLAIYPTKKIKAYAQVMKDASSDPVQGMQFGVWAWNILDHIDLQLERNIVLNPVYNAQPTQQSHTHYGYFLGHPLGGETREWIVRLGYRNGPWLVEPTLLYADLLAQITPDGVTHYGSRIPDAPPSTTPGAPYVNERLVHARLLVAYTFNFKTNLQLFTEGVSRTYFAQSAAQREQFIVVGVRTRIRPEGFLF